VQVQCSEVNILTVKQTHKKEVKEKADVEMDDNILSRKSVVAIITKKITHITKTGKGPQKEKAPKGGKGKDPKKGSTQVSHCFHPYPKHTEFVLEKEPEEGQVIFKGFGLLKEEVQEVQEEWQAKGLVMSLESMASEWDSVS
jgi:hypothetical protein